MAVTELKFSKPLAEMSLLEQIKETMDWIEKNRTETRSEVTEVFLKTGADQRVLKTALHSWLFDAVV